MRSDRTIKKPKAPKAISDFGLLLKASLAAQGLTAMGFATKIRVDRSFISGLMYGTRPVPLKGIEGWADVLALTGSARERFIEEALLTRAPAPIRIRFKQMREQLENHGKNI